MEVLLQALFLNFLSFFIFLSYYAWLLKLECVEAPGYLIDMHWVYSDEVALAQILVIDEDVLLIMEIFDASFYVIIAK